ncbi:hypothetical protein Tcan_00211 [Toxocara canis]|uniref:Uncharacterized protein n=1 Tax=Toxocara canis TaxID=6265 RepID=A0A0B2VTQ1_TOXCA|nr:hypothetical protein Tcan_00211 [Toxocara canis]
MASIEILLFLPTKFWSPAFIQEVRRIEVSNYFRIEVGAEESIRISFQSSRLENRFSNEISGPANGLPAVMMPLSFVILFVLSYLERSKISARVHLIIGAFSFITYAHACKTRNLVIQVPIFKKSWKPLFFLPLIHANMDRESINPSLCHQQANAA